MSRQPSPLGGRWPAWAVGLVLGACSAETVKVKTSVAGFADAGGDLGGGGASDARGGADADAATCVDGARRCSGAGRQRCGDGMWIADPCPTTLPACQDGTCRACVPNASRCQAGQRERCDAAGAWQPAPCPPIQPVCQAGACQLCVPGEIFCSSDGAVAAVAVCAASGKDTESLEPCQAGVACKGGHCQICAPGSGRCEGGKRERCLATGGSWQPKPCPAAAPICLGGACRACLPDTVRCQPEAPPGAAAVQVCSAEGEWTSQQACSAFEVCVNAACKTCAPGATRCVGGLVATCDDQGAGYTITANCAAAHQVCFAGACSCSAGLGVCGAPLPGTPTAKAVLACAGGATSNVIKMCAVDQLCADGSCLPCSPMSSACLGDVAAPCSTTGFDSKAGVDCGAAGQRCHQGACKAACEADVAHLIGCAASAFDPPRLAKGSDEPAPAPTATPAKLHLLGRAAVGAPAATALSSVVVGGLSVDTPSGTAQLGGEIALSLQTWNKLPAQSPTSSGQVPPIAMQWGGGGRALLSAGSDDGSDGALLDLTPVAAAGQEVLVVGWPSDGAGAEGYVAILNRGEACQLEIQAAGAIQSSPEGALGLKVPTIAAGAAWAAILPSGAALVLMAGPDADLTGTTIVCSGPISVLSGHRGARVPKVGTCQKALGAGPGSAGACLGTSATCVQHADCPAPCCRDALGSAQRPVAAWGSIYVVARSAARGKAPDLLRVVAADDGTLVVTVPPLGPPTLLDRGESLDLPIGQDLMVVATGKIAVAQLLVGRGDTGLGSAAHGDPAMATLRPVTAWTETWPVVAPGGAFSTHHLAIAAPLGAKVSVDGGPPIALQPILLVAEPKGSPELVAQMEASGFGAARVAVSAGPHIVRCTAPCQVVAHGYGPAAGYAE